MRITARLMDTRRRSPEEVTLLARDALLGEAWVVLDPEGIKLGFGLILCLCDFTPGGAKRVGALIGRSKDILSTSRINGWPMFGAMGLLHVEDLPMFLSEYKRLSELLGLKEEGE